MGGFGFGFGTTGSSEPKVLSVSGDVIRKRVGEYIENGRATVESYIRAAGDGIKLKGRTTWKDHIESVRAETEAMVIIRGSIGDGPHLMSIDEFKQMWNHFTPYRTAEQLVAAMAKEAKQDTES